VADSSIFGDRELEFLRELVRQKAEFIIVGLSAAALQGAPVVTQDIDLWFRELPDPGLERALKRVHGVYVPSTASTAPMLAGKGIELFDIVLRMDGLGEFDEEKKHTIRVSLGRVKVPVLDLERIIASKSAAGREKDAIVLKVLTDALRAIEERKRSGPRETD
jgi:predicted nucleotidyltransferase